MYITSDLRKSSSKPNEKICDKGCRRVRRYERSIFDSTSNADVHQIFSIRIAEERGGLEILYCSYYRIKESLILTKFLQSENEFFPTESQNLQLGLQMNEEVSKKTFQPAIKLGKFKVAVSEKKPAIMSACSIRTDEITP
nr:unnamed protein product [Callosobruchus chinensis]